MGNPPAFFVKKFPPVRAGGWLCHEAKVIRFKLFLDRSGGKERLGTRCPTVSFGEYVVSKSIPSVDAYQTDPNCSDRN